MNLKELKQLRADLGYVTSDPDSKLTNVQAFHLARAIRTVRDEVVRLEAVEERKYRTIPSLRDDAGPIARVS